MTGVLEQIIRDAWEFDRPGAVETIIKNLRNNAATLNLIADMLEDGRLLAAPKQGAPTKWTWEAHGHFTALLWKVENEGLKMDAVVAEMKEKYDIGRTEVFDWKKSIQGTSN